MLVSIHIENIAIISQLDVDLNAGFTVLTGETGAGKSIIIDALNLILGGRATREIIRQGEQSALVSAYFDEVNLDAAPECRDYNIRCDEDGGLMIRREISVDGRSSAKVNGATVPVSALKLLAKALVNIHGQHDSQALLNPDNHIMYLDSMSEDIAAAHEKYLESYRVLTDIRHQLQDITIDEREKQRQIEMYKFQLEDITSVGLKAGEEERLEGEKKRLSNIERVSKSVIAASSALYGGGERSMSAADQIRRAITALSPVSDIIEGVPDHIERLKSYIYEIEDIVESIAGYSETDGDPTAKLDKIEDRLEQITRLKRKYGGTIEQILQFQEDARTKLDNIIFSDEKIKALKKSYIEQELITRQAAMELTEHRKTAAQVLQKRVMEELAWLDMPRVIFEVQVKRVVEQTGGSRYPNAGDKTDEKSKGAPPKERIRYTKNGIDAVEFLIATNIGEIPKPLDKIASGGELSRIMLALKSVLAANDGVQTLIFDEIDIGISGKTSQKVGVKLREISLSPQVICVTHSAQIAALADTHIRIEKNELDGRAHTSLVTLDYEQRVEELSRIMGGIEITDTLRANAREMLGDR